MELKGPTSVIIKSAVFKDNNGAIATAKAVKMNPRIKNIGVKYDFFKSQIGADK